MNSTKISRLLLLIIRSYQLFISPILPARCRYYPTCSEYGKQAIIWHGAGRGGLLTLKRISRCHPLGGHGVDFVPLPLYKDSFYPVKNNFSLSNESNGIKDKIVSRETLGLERGIYIDRSSYQARLKTKLANGNG